MDMYSEEMKRQIKNSIKGDYPKGLKHSMLWFIHALSLPGTCVGCLIYGWWCCLGRLCKVGDMWPSCVPKGVPGLRHLPLSLLLVSQEVNDVLHYTLL